MYNPEMLVTTTNNIEGHKIVKYLEVVKTFKENCVDVEDDIDDMIDSLIFEAEYCSADAIVGLTIKSVSTCVHEGGTLSRDMIAYGTAVKIE